MTTPCTGRRGPHPLVTIAGWILLGLLIAAVCMPVGFCLAWMSDVVFGVKP